ncbi:hypothetical protein DIPPA_17807 [Diplonema papillatum]|nr:hypothetical protein DIPPA_17807 [Diplonema papillatum]
MHCSEGGKSDFLVIPESECKRRRSESCFYLHALARLGETKTDEQIECMIKEWEGVKQDVSHLANPELPPPQRQAKRRGHSLFRRALHAVTWAGATAAGDPAPAPPPQLTTGQKRQRGADSAAWGGAAAARDPAPTRARGTVDVTADHWASSGCERGVGQPGADRALPWKPSAAGPSADALGNVQQRPAIAGAPETALVAGMQVVVDVGGYARQAQTLSLTEDGSHYVVLFVDGSTATHAAANVRRLVS